MLILWDVDDVLNQLMREWLHFWQLKNKLDSKPVDVSQILENPPSRVLGIPLEQYLKSLDEFRNSSLGRRMTPHPEVLHWFQKFGPKFVHIALTARPSETMPNQAAWVYENFGRWIHSIVSVSPSRLESAYQRHQIFVSKASFIQWLDKPVILIDDSEDNIQEAKQHCLRTFLFPQPWNSSNQTTEDVLGELSQFLEK